MTDKQSPSRNDSEIDRILASCSELTEEQRAKAVEEAESICEEALVPRGHASGGNLKGTQIWLLAQALLDYRDAYIGGMAVQMALVKNAEQRLRDTQSETKRWIPVSERLPEKATAVLTALTGKYEADEAGEIEFMERRSEDCWHLIGGVTPIPNDAVSHWMPLPEAPK